VTTARASRRLPLLALLLVALGGTLTDASDAAKTPKAGPPQALTGAATALRGTATTLLGTVDPNGAATTYYFQYGPTVAYGKVTPTATLGQGFDKIKVGKAVSAVAIGYHYRLVASNADGTSIGNDRTISSKKRTTAGFKLVKTTEPTVYGGTYVLSGTLTGAGNANSSVELQSSPFPFLEPFAAVGIPSHTDAAGRFSFRVADMTKSTQFRVSTLDPRPFYSQVATQNVAARVTLKVRSSGTRGLVRLYGTVTPAKPGAPVEFQLFKQRRPGSSTKGEEKTTKFATQFSTIVRKGTSTMSRFSMIAAIQRGGSYRAYVKLGNKGSVVSGWSSSVLLHAVSSSTTATDRR
jgi:hypothetical protein